MEMRDPNSLRGHSLIDGLSSGSDGNASVCNAGDPGSILGLGRPSEGDCAAGRGYGRRDRQRWGMEGPCYFVWPHQKEVLIFRA